MRGVFLILNPKHEYLNPKQYQMTKTQNSKQLKQVTILGFEH